MAPPQLSPPTYVAAANISAPRSGTKRQHDPLMLACEGHDMKRPKLDPSQAQLHRAATTRAAAEELWYPESSKTKAPTWKNYERPSKLLDTPVPGSATALWEYMRSNVPELNRYESPRDLALKKHTNLAPNMILPRVRDIAFNPYRKPRVKGQKFDPKWAENMIALAVYLTGREALEPCHKCGRKAGPFKGCVMPADEVRNGTLLMNGCANCIYGWQAGKCSHQPKREKETIVVKDEDKSITEVPDFTSINAPSQPRAYRGMKDEDASEIVANHVKPRRSDRPKQPSIVDDDSVIEIIDMAAVRPQEPSEQPRQASRGKKLKTEGSEVAVVPPSPAVAPSWSSRPAGTVHLPRDLQLDEWEVAPGKIHMRTNAGTQADIAFASTYISDESRPANVHHGAHLHFVGIEPNRAHSWSAKEDHVRLCIVSNGRVHVQLEKDEFNIGPRGAFKIRAGMECVVENRLAITAVIHVVTLDEF